MRNMSIVAKGQKFTRGYHKKALAAQDIHTMQLYDTRNHLLGNCLNCGKVAYGNVDDPDICTFCSHPIWKAGEIARDHADENQDSMELREAKERTAQLLQFQETWSRRTHIYDDANDWFREANNVWTSEEIRQEAAVKAQQEIQGSLLLASKPAKW